MAKQIKDIEVLRAIAVVFVVVEHMQTNLIHWVSPGWTRFYDYFGGWTGVDLFFAISGFVIAKDLIPRLQQSNSTLEFLNTTLAFWIKRFWRLTPSAWFWLAAILFFCVFFNQTGLFKPFRVNFEGSIAAALNVANLHMALIFGNAPSGPNFIYWSLSLEEQFYLILPILVLLSGRWLPYVLGAVVVIQLFMVRDTLYEMMLRTDALFLGVLIAMWSKSSSYRLFEPSILKSTFARIIFLTVLLVGLATVGSDQLKMLDHRVGVITLISGILVLVASFDKAYIWPDGLSKKLMLWIGSRSYAIYLIHMPAFYLTRELWFRIEPSGTVFDGTYTYQFLLTAIGLLLLLSELNYRFLEKPLRRKGQMYAKHIQQRDLSKFDPTTPQQLNTAYTDK